MREQTMKKIVRVVAVILLALGSYVAYAQQPERQAPPPMSFFVTSVGKGDGANYGGLAGADAHCQMLARAAGSRKTFHAYLSTQGPGAVNARDRIGTGPWYNAKGTRLAQNVDELHGENAMTKQNDLNEKGEQVNGSGEIPNMHDIPTGSQLDGRAFTDGMDHTCNNWTSNSTGSAQLGHADRNGSRPSWNSVHSSRGCSGTDLFATGGAGLLYCFAID